ncbi:MAG TPA: GyrI-like domain-containing protein [bacterium]|nr:GyrI-like domain-containing protein [bacterium]
MEYQIELKTLPAQPAVSLRAVTPTTQIGATLERLLNQAVECLGQSSLAQTATPFVRYHETHGSQVELEAGLVLPQDAALAPGQVRAPAAQVELPGGPAVVTWHMGPYDALRNAYRALGMWLKDHGKQMAAPPWEKYWTDPEQEPNPQAWRTEVIWPVR